MSCPQRKIQAPSPSPVRPRSIWRLPPSTPSPAPPRSSPCVRTRQVSCHSPGPLYVLFPLPGNFCTLTARIFRCLPFREATLSKIRCPPPMSQRVLSFLAFIHKFQLHSFSYFLFCILCFLFGCKLPKERTTYFVCCCTPSMG